MNEQQYFDVTLEEEIERTKKQLERLQSHDKDAVFQCPNCKQQYRYVMNYNQLKMCGRCYVKAETEKLKGQTDFLIGAIIEKVEVAKPSPYNSFHEKVGITCLTVKLKDGKTVKLLQEQPVLRL